MKNYKKEEKKVDFYDYAYATNTTKYSLDISGYDCQYAYLYMAVKEKLNKEEKILELGCGTGQLAEILIKENYNYVKGVDFSQVGIDICNKRINGDFMTIDLYDYLFYDEYNTIVMLEVIEHLEQDLKVLGRIKEGAKVIFSVPTFPNEAHVRIFPNEKSITDRFGHLFKNIKMEKHGKIYLCECIKN